MSKRTNGADSKARNSGEGGNKKSKRTIPFSRAEGASIHDWHGEKEKQPCV